MSEPNNEGSMFEVAHRIEQPSKAKPYQRARVIKPDKLMDLVHEYS